jgi:hypothetical protein
MALSLVHLASTASAQEPPQPASDPVAVNRVVADRIYQELDQVRRAWKVMMLKVLSLARLSYKKSENSADLQAMTEEELRRRFCTGAAIDYGVQAGSIKGLHLDQDASFLILPPSSDLASRLIRHYRLVGTIGSKMEHLVFLCTFDPEKLPKDDMIALLVSLDVPTRNLMRETELLIRDVKFLMGYSP